MAKSTVLTVLSRDFTDIEAKLLTGLGTSVTATSISEALNWLGLVNVPHWVAPVVAIVFFFIGGYLKKSTIPTTDTGKTGQLEAVASAIGDDLGTQHYDQLATDAFKAAGIILDAAGNVVEPVAPNPAPTVPADPTAPAPIA